MTEEFNAEPNAPFRVDIGHARSLGSVRIPYSHTTLQRQIESCVSRGSPSTISIVVEGLDIDGPVHLRYLAGPEIALPLVTFLDCRIPELDFSVTNVGRIELVDCEMCRLRVNQCRVEHGISLHRVTFSANLVAGANTYFGDIDFYGSRFGADVRFDNVVCAPPWPQIFQMGSITVNGTLLFFECRVPTSINLDNATIDKVLEFTNNPEILGLTVRNAYIDGHFLIFYTSLGALASNAINGEGLEVGGAIIIRFSRVEGLIELIQCRIGVNLELIHTRCDNGESMAIEFGGAKINGNCFLTNFVCIGGIALRTSEIGGSLIVEDARLARPKSGPSVLTTHKLIIKGQCTFYNVNVDGVIGLGGASIGGSAKFTNVAFASGEHALGASIPLQGLDLTNCRIEGGLFLTNLTSGSGFWVSLRYATASFINDDYGSAYKSDGYFADVTDFRVTSHSVPNLEALNKQISFLRQYSGTLFITRKELHLQPYTHLASHLRGAGWNEAADKVLWEMKRIQYLAIRSPVARVGSWLFDHLFGYGYSKGRAVVTLLTWLAIGVVGTEVALQRKILIVDAPPVSSTVPLSRQGSTPQPTLSLLPAETTIANLPCGDAIDPLFYAIELILPIFDLGQKRQCTVRGRSETDNAIWPFREYVWWWLGKYIYTIGGWIIISLVVLTVVGSLKNRAES